MFQIHAKSVPLSRQDLLETGLDLGFRKSARLVIGTACRQNGMSAKVRYPAADAGDGRVVMIQDAYLRRSVRLFRVRGADGGPQGD